MKKAGDPNVIYNTEKAIKMPEKFVGGKSNNSTINMLEGMMFNFADAAGGELPGVVKSVSDELVEIDFNHPLAGHELTFKVEIIDVK